MDMNSVIVAVAQYLIFLILAAAAVIWREPGGEIPPRLLARPRLLENRWDNTYGIDK
jgi:hypothetical protein